MSDRNQGGNNQPGSPGMEQGGLRHQIDSGQTGDKVAVSDPATSPLGTDDEAAGTRPPAQGGSMAAGSATSTGARMSESPTGGGASSGAQGAGSLGGTSAGGRGPAPGAVSQSTEMDRRPTTRNWWIIVAAFIIVLAVVLYAFGVTWPTAGFRN